MARSDNKDGVIEVDEITLDGKRIRVRNEDLAIGTVKLDPTNPRLANTIKLEGLDKAASLQNHLEDLLWSDGDVHDLYRQVMANKGLIERIIVREDHVVVEGNCRTVVYRKLHKAFPDAPQWKSIPARILPADIQPRDIAILLGEMHVAGKNTWSPFEKAGHVHRLHKDFGLTQDEIAQRLRMSKSKVNQLIRAFDVMKNQYMTKYPGPSSIRKFSYFEELFKKADLRQWAEDEPSAVELFVDWVGTDKVKQGVQVRDLPAIVKNPEAVKAMTSGGIGAAKKVMEADNPALSSTLMREMVSMTEALKQARIDEVQRIKKAGNAEARRIVRELKTALDHFMDLCGLDTIKENDE